MRLAPRRAHEPVGQPTERDVQPVSRRHVDAVAQAIEAYLAGHPGAADNEHGIATWWLPGMGVVASVAEVLDALDALLQRGVVTMVALPGGSLYRAAAGSK